MPSLPEPRQPFVPPSDGDSRGPCPALNALANHGYLPHDGRNITLTELISACHTVFGTSIPLSTLLALPGVVACGHQAGLRRVLDLHDLARTAAPALVHDASLAHVNTPPGAAYASATPDAALVQALLDVDVGAPGDCPDGEGEGARTLTLKELCEAQLSRFAASPVLNVLQRTTARAELTLVHDVFGVTRRAEAPSSGSGDAGLVVPKVFVGEWLGHERLPDEWHGPLREVGVREFAEGIGEISKLEETLGSATHE